MLDEWRGQGLGQDGGVVDDGGDDVGVDVGGGASVLDVALSVGVHGLGGDSHGGGSVSGAVGELVEAGGLVDACQPLVVVLAVELHVHQVPGLELLHHVVDVVHAFAALSHRLGGEVGVAAGAVPVWEELWLERDGETLELSHSQEQVPGGEHVISLLESEAWAYLEFPLARHDLSICS